MARRITRKTDGEKGPNKKGKVRVEELAGKKRSRYLEGVTEIQRNDSDLLQRFMTEHGKIMPSRLTGTTAKEQRRIKKGIRRTRVVGLLP